MADKGGQRKAKAKREQASVLGNLPATRPQRLGRPRAGAAVADEPPPRRKGESPSRPPAAEPRPAAPAATSAPQPRTTGRAAAGPRAATTTGRGAKTAVATGRAAKAAGAKGAAPRGRAAKPAAAGPGAAATGRAAKPAGAKRTTRARRKAASGRPGAARRPAAVRPGVRSLEHQQRVGDPPPARTVQVPRGAELVTTTIQAVGELAQIGLTVGGRALKRAVNRLPRP